MLLLQSFSENTAHVLVFSGTLQDRGIKSFTRSPRVGILLDELELSV